ncbi:hypothetical protein [Nibribacter koreensis]|uniref:Uncharacterized protein n=1 Tax=Nibribacter koreensis TaxID=1084519 RepID=A0ABP8FB14_9BACT
MKIKALITFNSYFGTLLEGQTADVREGEGREYEKAGLVEVIDAKSAAEEPKSGKDMTAVNTKPKGK